MSDTRIGEIRELEGGDRFGWAWLDELELPEKNDADGETTEEWSQRCIEVGAAAGRFRQCSLGWHDECSDPEGEECKCPCHTHNLATTDLTNALRWITRACADLLEATP